jgi:hypothetical protein
VTQNTLAYRLQVECPAPPKSIFLFRGGAERQSTKVEVDYVIFAGEILNLPPVKRRRDTRDLETLEEGVHAFVLHQLSVFPALHRCGRNPKSLPKNLSSHPKPFTYCLHLIWGEKTFVTARCSMAQALCTVISKFEATLITPHNWHFNFEEIIVTEINTLGNDTFALGAGTTTGGGGRQSRPYRPKDFVKNFVHNGS